MDRIDIAGHHGMVGGDILMRIDLGFFRAAEAETLLGDPTNAKVKLGWVPEITVQEMCAEMVSEDLKTARRHALLKAHGHGNSSVLRVTLNLSEKINL